MSEEERGRGGPVRIALFDLDNVLYCSPKLAEETEKLISKFFREELGFTDDNAIEEKKKEYFRRYGLVLKGVLEDHPELDVEEYLNKVDGSLPLKECLRKDDELREMLTSIKPEIKKCVLSNAAKGHVRRTTRKLGIDDCFDAIIDIFALDFNPKPQKRAFDIVEERCKKLLNQESSSESLGSSNLASQCLVIDDNLDTIKAAREAGFQTVWIHAKSKGDSSGKDKTTGRSQKSEEDEAKSLGIRMVQRVHELRSVCPDIFRSN